MQFFNSGRLLHEVPLPEPAAALCTGVFTPSARETGTTQVRCPPPPSTLKRTFWPSRMYGISPEDITSVATYALALAANVAYFSSVVMVDSSEKKAAPVVAVATSSTEMDRDAWPRQARVRAVAIEQ